MSSKYLAAVLSAILLAVGTTKDRSGNPLTLKLQGPVEPYFRT